MDSENAFMIRKISVYTLHIDIVEELVTFDRKLLAYST